MVYREAALREVLVFADCLKLQPTPKALILSYLLDEQLLHYPEEVPPILFLVK